MNTLEIDFFGKKVSIETGKMAKQTNGSVVVSYNNTKVLVTVAANRADHNADFFPLTCSYQLKKYSQGKIPGGFIKRETKPSDQEVLISRLIDRPIRPLFEKGYNNETQVIATVLNYDEDACSKFAALLGASSALYLSDLPYHTPIAGVTVGRINNEFIINPTEKQKEESDLNLFLAGSKVAIIMVESDAKELEESVMLDALQFGHKSIQELIELQENLRKEAGKEKIVVKEEEIDENAIKIITQLAEPKIKEAMRFSKKTERYQAFDQVFKDVLKTINEQNEKDEGPGITEKMILNTISDLKKKSMRDMLVNNSLRVDGRGFKEIRPISCEVGLLSNAHGSALFTRGETQSLVVTTLGTKSDEQIIDDGENAKKFYLHYNFPAFSVGEVRRQGPPSRREVGHGYLAEKGLNTVIPNENSFPYTIRLVSEILEANGSTSMASVCGGTLSLMDAGVPILSPVAGIAMGLISEGDKKIILSDILGDEDHVGDMDFKVVGTEKGITALQMDIKIDGVSQEILKDALAQAKEGRVFILQKMKEAIVEPRKELSDNAPRYIQHKVPSNKIRDVIGPGGKNIRAITQQTGAKIDIEDSGMVSISSNNQKAAEEALELIREVVKEVEIGALYEGKVKKVVDFGAFVEVLPGIEGLVHISEIAEETVDRVQDHLEENQIIKVKAIGLDRRGKLKLSMKAAL